mmetsp:Transcript_11466/g.26583  ORF Transcript_11466/g.26583 Transcript_11466/m.26583 type:complete len:968 (+) Transcript_11466:1-2904(+)
MEIEQDQKEYSLRREIATKVLGSKMLQGYTLKERTCTKCGMPVMEYKGREDCVVCPALAKRARKELRKQQRLEKEKARLERRVLEKKAKEKQHLRQQQQQQQNRSREETPGPSSSNISPQEKVRSQREQLEHIQIVRQEIDKRATKDEEEAIVRAQERQKAIEEEKSRILIMEEQQQQQKDEKTAAKEEQKNAGFSIQARERARVLIEEEKKELERLESIAKEERDRFVWKAEHRGKEEKLAVEESERRAQRDAETKTLADEAKRILAFDEATVAENKTEAMKKDLLVEEHRKRMAEKATLDEEVARLEEDRLAESMLARSIAEERRVESESRMIAALEADAAIKALAAEDAIRRAKDALREVTTTKKQLISQTIEQAEKEAIAETEQTIKARFEDHNEPVILPSESELYKERWETLRMEGRAIMTRRVLQGWNIVPQACKGIECHQSPLIKDKNGRIECVVCGGDGCGTDGAYAASKDHKCEALPSAAAALPSLPKSLPPPVAIEGHHGDGVVGEDWLGNGQEEEFERKREIYSKEIGKRMLLGWMLIDSSCPNCIMPLMMDDKGNTDICIVCGEMKHHFDASTIATKDMATLEIVDEVVTPVTAPAASPAKELKPIADTADADDAVIYTAATTYAKIDSREIESDLVSVIREQAPKQQKRNPLQRDPPAFKPVTKGETDTNIKSDMIPLPTNVDFADADAIRELVGSYDNEYRLQQDRDDTSNEEDFSIDMVANMFLKSPHGYDFQDFGRLMGIDEVKELVEIFLVTNLDKDVSDEFKRSVAECILSKLDIPSNKIREEASPDRPEPALRLEPGAFHFGEHDEEHVDDDYNYYNQSVTRSTSSYQKAATRSTRRSKPCPEGSSRLPPKSPRRSSKSNTVIVGGPMSPRKKTGLLSPRSATDANSVNSHAGTVGSEALESLYDRIDQCQKKLLDPSSNLDEQIATAALLEKLAQAAVAVREMEILE